MKLFTQRYTNDRRTIKREIARIKHALSFGKLTPEQLAGHEAQKARLITSGLWT